MEQRGDPSPGEGGRPVRRWREVWQVPVLALALGGLVLGLATLVLTTPGPDLDGTLDRAERLVSQEEYERALTYLGEHVHPYTVDPGLTPEQRRRFHLLTARSLYQGQRALGIDRRENNHAIVAEYMDAERADARLTPEDQYKLARTYLSLGRVDEARQRADRVRDESRPLRDELYRRLVEHVRRPPNPDNDTALTLLANLLSDPELPVRERAWAVATQAEVMLDRGYPDEAVARLLRAMPRLSGASKRQHAELFHLLARGYFELEDFVESQKNAERTEALLDDDDPLMRETALLRGRIDRLHGEIEEARQRFADVVAEAREPELLHEALLELGEVEAELGRPDDSLEAYSRLVGDMDPRSPMTGQRRRVLESLLGRHAEQMAREDLELALRFAQVAEEMYTTDEVPANLLRLLGQTHRRLADAELDRSPGDPDVARAMSRLDPATRREVRRSLIAAGSYFRRHADAVVLTDSEAYADSLWLSADSYDRAGDAESAIAIFQEYVSELPNEPRRAEARFRLGQAYQARGEYGLAADYYRGLIVDRSDPEVRGVGLYADRSYVPLAQTYLKDGDPSTDAEAERLLRQVVSGRLGGTGTPTFREALLELGRFYYERGDNPRAAEVLEEALQRYPDDPRIDEVRFRLADAYRLDAREIERTLQRDLPDGQARALRETRAQRLERALELFDTVRRSLESRDARRMTRLEEEYLRNAHFYMGACAFDLGDHAAAIRFYDAARERYPRDPASLVAMVQIVNAHVAQGDFERARTAHERAKRFYSSLPDDVWDNEFLPMGRREWERWLDSMTDMHAFAAAGGE